MSALIVKQNLNQNGINFISLFILMERELQNVLTVKEKATANQKRVNKTVQINLKPYEEFFLFFIWFFHDNFFLKASKIFFSSLDTLTCVSPSIWAVTCCDSSFKYLRVTICRHNGGREEIACDNAICSIFASISFFLGSRCFQECSPHPHHLWKQKEN